MIRRAIQQMVARARLEHGKVLRDFDITLPGESFDALRAEIRDEFGAEVGTEGRLVINTANGPTRILRRTEAVEVP